MECEAFSPLKQKDSPASGSTSTREGWIRDSCPSGGESEDLEGVLVPKAVRRGELLHCEADRTGEMAVRRLLTLAWSEDVYRPRADYIESVQKHGMVEEWRVKITAWFDQLGEAFDMKSETVAMATNYLDRYLSRRSCGGVNLQLAATASIFLASKVEEQRPFRTSDLVTLSGGLLMAEDIRLMELELVSTLGWYLNPPTIHASVHQLLVLLERQASFDFDGDRLERAAFEFADRSRGQLAFLKFPPSMIAVAAVVCALRDAGGTVAASRAFLDVVRAVGFPYAQDDDAPHLVKQCGLLLLDTREHNKAPPCDDADDLEVRNATENADDHPLLADSDDDDMAHEHAPSPTDVMDTGRIHDFARAPSPFKRHKPAN